MTIRRTDAYRDAITSAQNTAIGASAQVQVRSGVNAGTGGQGVLLAQLTGNVGGWGTSTNGVLTSSAITADSSADATGTAGHYQLNTSGAVFLESGLIDGGDGVTIDNASIVAAQTVQMSGNWVNTAAYDDGV
ncbi:hypothetical protein K0U83_11550 [bacterium]|nr:hypothetical protein [bacterium]